VRVKNKDGISLGCPLIIDPQTKFGIGYRLSLREWWTASVDGHY
jgi:hypothetical protein